MKKDCFDSCSYEKCWKWGTDVIPSHFCLIDPVIDRFEKRKNIKRPCNTCLHRDTRRPCCRCEHGQKEKP